jgi:hypothetical protein
MAKTKSTARKKKKGSKASAKPAREAAARATAKTAKSKVRRAGSSRIPMKKLRPPKAAAVINEPLPGVVDVTEDEAIQTVNSTPA